MKTDKQITFRLLVLGTAVITLAIFGYLNFDFIKEKIGVKNIENTASTTKITDIIDSGELEIIVPEDLPQPIPDLDAPINYNANLSAEVRVLIDGKIKELKDILRENPGDFDSWIQLGIRYKTVEDYEKVIECWRYASLLRPNNTLSFNNLGDLQHYFLRDYEEAEKNFLIALENDPSYIYTYFNLHDLYKYSYKQDTNNAVDILLKGLEVDKNNIDLLIKLASYYEYKGNIGTSIKYYKKVVEQAGKMNNSNLVVEINEKIANLKQ